MTYELIDLNNGKVNIKYSGGEFDGLTELYSQGEWTNTIRPGYINATLPNYYSLEQTLFKSPLFAKYIAEYNANGLLFTQTINNGKRGEDVNENTILLGLQVMGIAFTQAEVEYINQVLTDNNFTIQI